MPKFTYANKMRRNRGGPYKTKSATDLLKWRLKSVDGRQTWHYLESEEENKIHPQTLLDKHSLGLSTVIIIHVVDSHHCYVNILAVTLVSFDIYQLSALLI